MISERNTCMYMLCMDHSLKYIRKIKCSNKYTYYHQCYSYIAWWVKCLYFYCRHSDSAHTETAGNETMTMAAEVGLLTRNIRVEGASYNKLYSQSFGARIMVSQTQDPSNSKLLYIGEKYRITFKTNIIYRNSLLL